MKKMRLLTVITDMNPTKMRHYHVNISLVVAVETMLGIIVPHID